MEPGGLFAALLLARAPMIAPTGLVLFISSEVVVGAAAILTRDALDDIDRFNTSHSVFLKAPRIIFSCTICIPLRTVLRFILPIFAFGIRFRLNGFCVTFGAFSLPLILLNGSSMPPHREGSEPPSTLCSNALQNYCFFLTWQWVVP